MPDWEGTDTSVVEKLRIHTAVVAHLSTHREICCSETNNDGLHLGISAEPRRYYHFTASTRVQ